MHRVVAFCCAVAITGCVGDEASTPAPLGSDATDGRLVVVEPPPSDAPSGETALTPGPRLDFTTNGTRTWLASLHGRPTMNATDYDGPTLSVGDLDTAMVTAWYEELNERNGSGRVSVRLVVSDEFSILGSDVQDILVTPDLKTLTWDVEAIAPGIGRIGAQWKEPESGYGWNELGFREFKIVDS